ncbi:hypothetical protein D3C84_309680 [compost metagenome]
MAPSRATLAIGGWQPATPPILQSVRRTVHIHGNTDNETLAAPSALTAREPQATHPPPLWPGSDASLRIAPRSRLLSQIHHRPSLHGRRVAKATRLLDRPATGHVPRWLSCRDHDRPAQEIHVNCEQTDYGADLHRSPTPFGAPVPVASLRKYRNSCRQR